MFGEKGKPARRHLWVATWIGAGATLAACVVPPAEAYRRACWPRRAAGDWATRPSRDYRRPSTRQDLALQKFTLRAGSGLLYGNAYRPYAHSALRFQERCRQRGATASMPYFDCAGKFWRSTGQQLVRKRRSGRSSEREWSSSYCGRDSDPEWGSSGIGAEAANITTRAICSARLWAPSSPLVRSARWRMDA